MAAKNLTEVVLELEARIVETRRRVDAEPASSPPRTGYAHAIGYLDALTEMRDWVIGAEAARGQAS